MTLESTRLLLLAVHLVAVASVLVGWVVQLAASRPHRLLLMVVGAAAAAGTGIALVVVRQLADLPVEPAKIAVKLLITTLVLVAVIVAAIQRRALAPSGPGPSRPQMFVRGAGVLALANVVVAVAWT